jgi:hypothetical protein
MFKSSTNTVFILLSTALVVLTFMKIVDAKDFTTFVGMAFTAKFLKNKTQV